MGTVSLCGLGGGEALLERVQLVRIRCVPALQQREHLRERARKALPQQLHANILTQRRREPYSAAGWTGFSFIHPGTDLNLIKNSLEIVAGQTVSGFSVDKQSLRRRRCFSVFMGTVDVWEERSPRAAHRC